MLGRGAPAVIPQLLVDVLQAGGDRLAWGGPRSSAPWPALCCGTGPAPGPQVTPVPQGLVRSAQCRREKAVIACGFSNYIPIDIARIGRQ